MTGRLLLPLAASILIAAPVRAQSQPDPRGIPPWADTTGESGVYPHGDAVGVYRAALDLLYKAGNKRPSIIVMHDTAEGRGDGPCPIACARVWPHKSTMDTATILAFARQSPKRPRIRDFGYDIPIVLISYDDVERMRHDGLGYLATHKAPSNLPGGELWVEFERKYPGAWGFATFTRAGFNDGHTEALVQVRHSCGETCGSDEILFMKRTKTQWTVIERIPNYAEASLARGNLRYRGPAGTNPTESELLVAPSVRPSARSESVDGAAVYRAVLDSLYSFQGESPKMVVLTDRFRTAEGNLRSHKSRIDSALLQKYAFLGGVRALPDMPFTYRLPVAVLPRDSIPILEELGIPLERETNIASPFWLAFKKKYPNAWGMVGVSRVAFDLAHTQALVYSNHQCGQSCDHGDTWMLERTGEKWSVVERIPREKYTDWESWLWPLRYVGLDAKPNAYRRRRVWGVFTNAVTNRPLSFLRVTTRSSTGESRVLVADSRGRIALGRMPLQGAVAATVACPDQSRPDSIHGFDVPITPGLDTTITRKLDFRECFRESREPTPRTLTGAEASISETDARFVFPRRATTYTWDLPFKGAYPGGPEYIWEVDWDVADDRDGKDPLALWLIKGWKPGGPRKGTLADLIARDSLEAMINWVERDAVVFADPETNHGNVLASVENGQLVFTIRGREAVRRIFPTVPRTVNFETRGRRIPMREYGPGDAKESQTVFVNCRNFDSSAASRRRCDVPSKTPAGRKPADPTAPRRMQVVVLSYDGASLMRNLSVRVESEDKNKPSTIRSTGSRGSFSMLHPPSDSVTLEALCPESRRGQRNISGRTGLYITPGADTTVQLLVDPRVCGLNPST